MIPIRLDYVFLPLVTAGVCRTRTPIFRIGFHAGFCIPTGDLMVFILRAIGGMMQRSTQRTDPFAVARPTTTAVALFEGNPPASYRLDYIRAA